MKRFAGFLIVFAALAVAHYARGEPSAKSNASNVSGGLAWPVIKNPEVLIAFAEAEIRQLTADGKNWNGTTLDLSKKPEIAYLRPLECLVMQDFILIILDTRPFTGQVLLVLPEKKTIPGNQKLVEDIEDTVAPKIKRAVLHAPLIYQKEQMSLLERASVRFRNIMILEKNEYLGPKPLEMRLPVYSMEMIRAGISGEANVAFSVTQLGGVSGLQVKAITKEFESAVRDAASYWRFEPGVDESTRQPMDTHMSLTVLFTLDE